MKTTAADRRAQNTKLVHESWLRHAEDSGTFHGIQDSIKGSAPAPRTHFDRLVSEGKMSEAYFDTFLAAYVAEFSNPENA